MTDSFSLPLRPLTERSSKKDSLPIHIAQINAQRGSFRNVTEASLHAEIDKPKDVSEDNETVAKDTPDRREQLFKNRAEILEFTLNAHTEATYALDFLSLLLSKHTRHAEHSMSPYLKQNTPLGSLAMDVVKLPDRPEYVKRDIDAVSRGWKLENFNAAANKLLKSASRLEEEVAAETQYWDEVLRVKESGWKVCRLPRNRQTLGVQLGFLEAAPSFRDRGLVALRRGDSGRVVLDKGLSSSKRHAVRVSVQQGGRTVGSSSVPSSATPEEGSVEENILQARDALFEEELFYELNREARVLAHHGVETRRNLVQFKASDSQEVLVELLDLDDPTSLEKEPPFHDQNALAETVAIGLRILLCHAHRQNLRRRSQIPPPLSAKKRPTPEYHLLRPIVAFIQHSSHLKSLESFMNPLYRTLHSADLKCEYKSSPFASIELSGSNDDSSTVEAIVHTFLSPIESTIHGTLISQNSFFDMKIRTHVDAASIGTEYEFSINFPAYPELHPPARLALKNEVEGLISQLFTLDLVSIISSFTADRQSAKKSIDGTGSARASRTAASRYLELEMAYPYHGEIIGYSRTRDRSRKLVVNLDRSQLTLRGAWMAGPGSGLGSLDRGNSVDVLHTWMSDTTQGRTFTDVVAESVRDNLGT